jgi:hypothetical protein
MWHHDGFMEQMDGTLKGLWNNRPTLKTLYFELMSVIYKPWHPIRRSEKLKDI